MKLHNIESIQAFSHEGKVYLIFNSPICRNIPDAILVGDTEEVVLKTDNPYVHNNHMMIVVEHDGNMYIIPRIDDTRAVVIKVGKGEKK